MGDKYAVTCDIAVTVPDPGDTAMVLMDALTTRAYLYELIFSQGGSPADNIIRWVVRRFTTSVGTGGSAIVATPLDPASPAALITANRNTLTTEPTYTAASELLDFDLNQRATFRWVAAPGGELVMAAAAATNGIGVTPMSPAYAGISNVVAHWDE